jgi:sugar lactone lactonase YvrE
MSVEQLSAYKAILGEGPLYDIELDKLFWVDIEGKKILIKDLDNYLESAVDVPDLVSSLCVIDENNLITTIRHGFYTVNLKSSNNITKIAEVEVNSQDNRFNDGKCDSLGRYWAGTMNMKKSGPTGSLYKLEGKIEKILDNLTVSNGLGWNPDNNVMYLIDSPVRKVYAFDYDKNKGEIYNKRVLIDFNGEQGNPDGMTVDEEGYLWIAHWGGGKISRWSPLGKKVYQIKLAVTYVTSVTFGTYEMNRLFITTASKDDEPLSGKIFTIKIDVRGLPSFRFKKGLLSST